MRLTNTKKPLLLTSAMLLSSAAVAMAEGDSRPNFLFILADDQDPATLDIYGDTECSTPNLDQLARDGVALTGAHQMGSFIGAVSTASRTMIMTGKNVWNAMELRKNMTKYKQGSGNADIVKESAPEYYSLPAIFHRAGYETYRTCKQGNSYDAANALFDERHDKVCRSTDDATSSKWHADNVIDYFERRSAKGDSERKPFLIYLGFSHPHDPRNGREDLLEKYGSQNIETPTEINSQMPSLPNNWLPEKLFHDGHLDLRDECKVYGVMTRRDEATIRNEKGKEFACIEYMDTQIGRVLEALEQSGELENTYIIFTADHGISVGKHAYMGKQNLYEHTFRVPFLVKGPGIKSNSTNLGNIYLMDLLPTLCDLAEIDPQTEFDGKSFKSVLYNDQKSIRDILYGVYSGGSKPGIRCVKSGDWKLVKYDVLDGTIQKTQLFNLKKNPDELTIEHHDPAVVALTGNKPKSYQVDLSTDPRYADKLAEMEALLLEQMVATGDPWRLWNQPQK